MLHYFSEVPPVPNGRRRSSYENVLKSSEIWILSASGVRLFQLYSAPHFVRVAVLW